MKIASGKVTLEFFNNEQVALKHRHLEEVCKSLRKRFQLSAREIDEFDDPVRCQIGFAIVIPDNWDSLRAQKLMEEICEVINAESPIRVIAEDCAVMER